MRYFNPGSVLVGLVVPFMASRGRDVLQIEEYLVGGRSFSGVLLFFLAVGEIYSIGYILLAYPVGYFLGPLMWRAGKRYGATSVRQPERSAT